MDNALHANRVHRLVCVNHESSRCLVTSAPIANAKGIEKPTKPVYSNGGWISIPGDCSSGLSPLPSEGTSASWVKGLAGKTSNPRKNTATPARTAPAHDTNDASSERALDKATTENSIRSAVQNSSEPSIPPHNAASV